MSYSLSPVSGVRPRVSASQATRVEHCAPGKASAVAAGVARALRARHGVLAASACCVALAGASVLAPPAHAQTAAQTERLEEIVVTGTRIGTIDNLATPNPVVTVSAEDIEISGQTDIANLLRDIPALNSTLTANQSSQSGAPAGTGLLNLRGLGTNRTLVLVNGRRHVSGVAGSAAVDVSSIPVSMIQRVEVLTGGASAIYGADGVSGVVNFVMRDDFEGIEYRTQFGMAGEGDGEDFLASVTAGANFNEGRGNVVVNATYSNSRKIVAGDRDFAGPGRRTRIQNSPELAEFLGVNPEAANTFTPNQTLPVSSPLGIIWLEDANFAFAPGIGFANIVAGPGEVGGFPIAQVVDETGTLRPYNPADIFVGLFESFGGDGIQAHPPIEWLQPNLTRVSINANLKYELAPAVNFFTEAKFSRNDTQQQFQVNGFNDDIPISLDNPYIPDALRAQVDSLIDQGIDPVIHVSRDNLDVPSRSRAEQSSFRIVSGLEGEFANGISYEFSYNFGRTSRDFINQTLRVEDRFFAAVDAVTDPETGQIVCRSDLDPTAVPPIAPFPDARDGFLTFDPGDGQCQPINIFGRNTTSDEARDFIFQRGIDNSTITQQVVSLIFDGDTERLFSLPGGAVGWAVGAEWREEKSDFRPNQLEQSGLAFNTQTTRREAVEGEFDVWEVFGEVALPLLADRTFARELTLTGAVRFADYSTVGAGTTWSTGLTWSPVEDIRFRGSVGQAIRAPNINELFSPPQPIFLGAANDPCNPGLIGGGSEFREENCLELVGPGFDSTDFVSAFITGRAGGNPDLEEEKADTLTIGIVLTPTAMPNFSAAIDFYDVTIKNAIDSVDAQTLVNNCVDAPSLDNVFCEAIDRDPEFGFITFFRSGEENVSKLEVRGIDFDLRYGLELSRLGWNNAGDIDFSVIGSRTLHRNDFQFQDFPDEFEARLGENTFPRWLVSFGADWRRDRLRVNWTTRYQSSQLINGVTNQNIEGNPLFSDPFKSGGAYVNHLSGSYDLYDDMRLTLGVNNLNNRKPYLNNLVRPTSYVGRFFYAGLSGRF